MAKTLWISSESCLAYALCQKIKKYRTSFISRAELMNYVLRVQRTFNSSETLDCIVLDYFDRAVAMWPEFFKEIKSNNEIIYCTSRDDEELILNFSLPNIEVNHVMLEKVQI